jgi:hypothetical protein
MVLLEYVLTGLIERSFPAWFCTHQTRHLAKRRNAVVVFTIFVLIFFCFCPPRLY